MNGQPFCETCGDGPCPNSCDEQPMPPVKRGCFRCGVTDESVKRGRVIVSPTRTAHYSHLWKDNGRTRCGIDATLVGWWWPL